ncbi:hypothetical protein C1645_833429 [Glomus cerebriforme]|uniref:DUF7431 domain-containing protein n=1 Tax=Glomus cerebriforme TaxID=658196 RepID=A0A397SCI3_9GLOM|nr:hypothetical protein C1645_833429 [Glomus cerebriforme]
MAQKISDDKNVSNIINEISDYLKNSNKLKLEFGRTLTSDSIKVECADNEDNKVFTIFTKQIKLIELDNSINEEEVEFDSKEEWMKKINMFLNEEADMINYGSLGISFLDTQDENQKNLSYNFTIVPRMSLTFDTLEPTQEFIEEVKEAIKSKNREKFKEIYKKFGQFVPTEVILGGIVCCVTEKGSNEQVSTEDTTNSTGENLSFKQKKKYSNLIGDDLGNFNKNEWIKSFDTLNNYKTWECVEFRKPINIFQLLEDNFKKEIYKIFGKKILYSSVMYYSCRLEYGERSIVELPLHEKIHKTIKNKDTECNVFATVVDDEEKNFFNCQIYHPQNEKPRLIIHCYQKKQKYQSHQLRIGFMIIGYDPDFNLKNLNDEIHLEVYGEDNEDNQESGDQELKSILTIDLKEASSFLGIPVLRELNKPDESIIIGHYFLKNENNIETIVFSYNLKENKYVKLPNFRFYVLTISGGSKTTCDIISFEKRRKFMKNEWYIDLEKYFKNISLNPKYISVCSDIKDCGPVFLNQKRKEIKLEHVNCECNGTCSICKGKDKSYELSDVKCAYFVSNNKILQ